MKKTYIFLIFTLFLNTISLPNTFADGVSEEQGLAEIEEFDMRDYASHFDSTVHISSAYESTSEKENNLNMTFELIGYKEYLFLDPVAETFISRDFDEASEISISQREKGKLNVAFNIGGEYNLTLDIESALKYYYDGVLQSLTFDFGLESEEILDFLGISLIIYESYSHIMFGYNENNDIYSYQGTSRKQERKKRDRPFS